MPQVDYAALAEQARSKAAQPVDYAALANKARTATAPSPSPVVRSEPSRDWSAQMGLHAPTSNRAVGFLRGAGTAAVDMLEGAASGAASTVYQGGDLVRRAVGMDRIIDTPTAQERMRAPETFAGQAGRMVEQGAEFAVPLTRVSRAVQGAGIVKRAGAEALASAGVAGVQSGGDSGAMTVAGAGGAVLPFVGAALRGARSVVSKGAAGAKDGGIGGAIAAVARKVAPLSAKGALTQGLKPRASLMRWDESLDRAIPEIDDAAQRVLGRKPETLVDTHTAATAAKRRVWSELQQVRGTAQGFAVDGSPIADAMVRSIPKKLRLENPTAAQSLEQAANAYRKPFPLDEMEQLLKETNADMDGFYAKYPQAQRKAMLADPEWARLDAQAKAMRLSIDGTLDRAVDGAGNSAKELRRRYGALMDVESAIERRVNVAARQQPQSLAEQIAEANGVADRAAGAYRIGRGVMTGSMGDVISGGADIVRGQVRRETAKFLKEQQTTDALIKRAFSAYNGKRVPVEMPQARPVRGMLGPGPIVTPPPADPSFVRGVPAVPSLSGRPRQLGPGRTPIVTPPPADRSGGRVIPAAAVDYQIDPYLTVKGGGFRAQFSGDPDAVQAAIASPPMKAMLERMKLDLDEFRPQRGKLVWNKAGQKNLSGGTNAYDDTHYAQGVAGSPVGDDIRVISEQHVGNAEIMAAIDDLIAGKLPTNRLHTAALDAAMGYLEKRPSYRGPMMPEQAAEQADDGFEAFSRAVDELAD